MMVLDACIAGLWEELSGDPDDQWIIASPRGYALGEHRAVGLDRDVPYSESTAVPLMIADWNMPVGWRSQNLVQPSLVADAIRIWLAQADGEEVSLRSLLDQVVSRAVCRADGATAIRTADWLLVQSAERNELYAKPDDRWEFNDVSSRCPEVVDQLLEMPRSEEN
jgi:hypothetical protein